MIPCGGSLSQMTVTTATTEDGTTTTTTDTLYFAYDAAGTPQTVTHNGTAYYYATNLQGDVVSILNASGTAVVSYTYDAWGNILTTSGTMADTLGTVNPLTYRGYVYDAETESYYLQSRYYNPEVSRFVNADALVSTGQGLLGNNMFAYCRNNPVSRKDASGTEDVCVENYNEDKNPLNDLGNPSGSGGGIWSSFTRTLKHAADGLKMASGQRNISHIEKHHLLSDKSKKYTPQYTEITDRYQYALDDESNLVTLEGHRGRHTNAYHEFMILAITELDVVAAGNPSIFTDGMKVIGNFILDNSWIPYAKNK